MSPVSGFEKLSEKFLETALNEKSKITSTLEFIFDNKE
jgi:hypothetical protein